MAPLPSAGLCAPRPRWRRRTVFPERRPRDSKTLSSSNTGCKPLQILMTQTETIEKRITTDLIVPDSETRCQNCRPLRIMHVVNSLGRGGTEFGVLKLLAGLD